MICSTLQKKYWNKLMAAQKIAIMDILFSLLEFAASYNSYTNLKLRMQQIPTERFELAYCLNFMVLKCLLP